MQPELAREIARQLAARMQATVVDTKVVAPDGEPINLAGVLCVGATVVLQMAHFMRQKPNDSLTRQLEGLSELFRLGRMTQQELEDVLHSSLVSDAVSAEEMREALDFVGRLVTTPAQLRSLVNEAAKEIETERLQESAFAGVNSYAVAERAAELVTYAELLLNAQAVFATATPLEVVERLAVDNLSAAATLAPYVGAIQAAMQSAEFAALKQIRSKAQFLADAIAGREIAALSPSYAHQKAEEGRRLRNK